MNKSIPNPDYVDAPYEITVMTIATPDAIYRYENGQWFIGDKHTPTWKRINETDAPVGFRNINPPNSLTINDSPD